MEKLLVDPKKASNTVAIICEKTLCPKNALPREKNTKKLQKNLPYDSLLVHEVQLSQAYKSLYEETVFTTKSPEFSGSHLIDSKRMKDRINLGAT